jgi:hypothetical protein
MTKGVRWLIGGLSSGVLLAMGMFLTFFGGIWFTVGSAAQVFDGRTVTGTVVTVDVPSPGAGSGTGGGLGSSTPDPTATGGAQVLPAGRGVTVRYVPIDSHGTALPEVTAWSSWSGATVPQTGQQVPVSYLYFDPSAPLESGGTGMEAVGKIGSGFRSGGSGILTAGLVLLGLAVAGFITTAIWASRGPSAAPRPVASGPPGYPQPGYPGSTGYSPGPYPPGYGHGYPGQQHPQQPHVPQGRPYPQPGWPQQQHHLPDPGSPPGRPPAQPSTADQPPDTAPGSGRTE